MEGSDVELTPPASSVEAEQPRSRFDPRSGKRMTLQPESFWRDHETRRQASGESIAAYCEANELALSTYRRWANRIEGRGPRRSSSKGKPRVPAVPVSPGFLPMPIRASASPASVGSGRAASIEIEAGEGMMVRLYDEAARSALELVLSRLGAHR